jgi:hypothetical protein
MIKLISLFIGLTLLSGCFLDVVRESPPVEFGGSEVPGISPSLLCIGDMHLAQTEMSQYFPNHSYNYAYGSFNVSDIASVTMSLTVDIYPDICIISAGTNDLISGTTTSDYIYYMGEIIDKMLLKVAAGDIYITSVVPTTTQNADDYNLVLELLCLSKGVNYIHLDYLEIPAPLPNTGCLRLFLAYDEINLNMRGRDVLVNHIKWVLP